MTPKKTKAKRETTMETTMATTMGPRDERGALPFVRARNERESRFRSSRASGEMSYARRVESFSSVARGCRVVL